METIEKSICSISNALDYILSAFTPEPSAVAFLRNSESLIKLEQVFNKKALLDAAIAKAAKHAQAGTLVGSTSHVDFLVKKLGISRAEALRRVKLAEELFGNPEPAPAPESNKQENKRKDQQSEAERKKAVNSTKNSAISAEKLSIINAELHHLHSTTKPTRSELLNEAIAQAQHRSPEDLRDWVRHRVRKINTHSSDPFAASRKRFLHLSAQDNDGGVRLHGYLSGDQAAGLKAALEVLIKQDKASATGDSLKADTRTIGQRYADGLSHILNLFNQGKLAEGRNKGIGTIVVSLSASDIADLEEHGAGHRYPTNTGIRLTPFEILNLGASKYDFGVVLDDHSGRPLYLGRMKRSASIEQRIALLASQLVCGAPGCSRPLIECEIHHMNSWINGGLTNIDNLTGLCFHDHPNNDDSRTGVNNKGYVDTDPRTGQVGFYPADGSGPIFNNTAAQAESGGAQVRERHRNYSTHTNSDPPDDGSLFSMPA